VGIRELLSEILIDEGTTCGWPKTRQPPAWCATNRA
jgi:hypothetical protein